MSLRGTERRSVPSKKIYVVGSLNIDLVTRMERLPNEGETVWGSDLVLFPGGKGANQVCAAARLGGRALMIGQIGTDPFGDYLRASLRDAGVDAAGVGICTGSTGAACVSVLTSGENAIVISPGANATLSPETAVSRLGALESGDLVLLQLEVPLATVEAVTAFAAGRGAVSMLDPAPAQPLSRELLRRVDYLTPNQSEASLLLQRPETSIASFEEAEEAASRLLELGPKAVLLKLGRAGCFVAADGFRGGIEGFAVQAVDTTAAGDTFNGALAVGLAEGMLMPFAAIFANAAAAISVTRPGAQSSIPDRDEVMAFLTASGRPLQEAEEACS
jgi:ribokinase